ncbi:MAG: S-layer homology domain-containing protein, partial [Clostridiaceae bacterium]|nr:S-layer homology domain-containing protein [Clostridiaceae bacterium]
MNAYKYAKGTDISSEAKKATVKFNDENELNNWARNAVYAALANGIIGGMPGNVYSPKENAKREQAARVIIGLMELLGEI